MKHLDKNSLKHFGVNFICGLFGVFGIGVGVGASLTKEYCDKIYGSHWCWVDLLADTIGLAAGFAVNQLIARGLS